MPTLGGIVERFLADVIERFVSATATCQSVDCVLVRLSSAFLKIKDLAEGFSTSVSEEELIIAFLNHQEVLKVLAGLADNIEAVEDMIWSDPRFKILRPYTFQIINAIKRGSQIYVAPRVYYDYEKPPLWRIEYEEHKAREVEPYTSYEMEEGGTGFRRSYSIPVSYEAKGGESGSRRVSLPRVDFSKVSLILYAVLLAITAYVFVEVPWIAFYGEQYYIGSLKTVPVKISSSGWDMTWFFIELWRSYNVRPPMFIAYFIGLLLAVIALVARSSIISAISGLAMLIGWYDFYTSAATIHKLYVQLIGVIGLINIKSAELEIGVTIAGLLAILHLTVGTYLIHKAAD